MPLIGYVFILLVCIVVGLVCFDKVRPKAYPFILYGMGTGMVLITTLAGPYLVGSDIHLDYYYAQLRAGADVMAPIVGLPQGTSIITYMTGNIWIFKVLYPIMFALVPPLLYLVFKKWLPDKQAFLAGFFFIAFPAFSMELPSIARQMVAEVFLAGSLYLIYVSSLRSKFRIPLLVICGVLMPLIHYAVGFIALILLGSSFLLKEKKKEVILVLSAITVTSLVYFPIAEGGAVAIKIGNIYNYWAPKALEVPLPEVNYPISFDGNMSFYPGGGTLPITQEYEALIYSGLGLDFKTTTLEGRVFRITTWVLLILMVLGVGKLRKHRKYWIFAGGGILLCILLLIPGFSNLLNATRFLHLILFVLAPILVVSLKPRYLLPILLTYFLFTSGFIFEVTKQPNVEKLTIPYSIGLSNNRIDLGATFTKDDIDVRSYVLRNNLFPIYADIFGADFIGEVLGWRSDLFASLRTVKVELRHNSYIFVRTRNAQEGTFTAWNGVGCRKYMDPLEYYSINWDENIIYQKGDARVIWVP